MQSVDPIIFPTYPPSPPPSHSHAHTVSLPLAPTLPPSLSLSLSLPPSLPPSLPLLSSLSLSRHKSLGSCNKAGVFTDRTALFVQAPDLRPYFPGSTEQHVPHKTWHQNVVGSWTFGPSNTQVHTKREVLDGQPTAWSLSAPCAIRTVRCALGPLSTLLAGCMGH